MNALEQIKALARRLSLGEITLSQLPQVVAELGVSEVPAQVWQEIATQLDHAPRAAYALACVTSQLAQRSEDKRPQAEAGLLLARALNACGEFRAAIAQCEPVGQAFQTLAAFDAAARTWCEAAWAQTYLGELSVARAYLERAGAALERCAPRTAEADLIPARIAWIEGRILRDQGEYTAARRQFEDARQRFADMGETLNAARCTRELGHTYARTDAAQALGVLEEARQVFSQADCPTELALGDFSIAQSYWCLHRFSDALDLTIATHMVFSAYGLGFFAAFCDQHLGLVNWQLNRFDVALAALQRARDYFLACGAEAEVSSCDINIGMVLSDLNRYHEAIVRFEQAAQQALAGGRRKKAARCYNNIAWAYDKQGRYADALNYNQRARDEFEHEQMIHDMALCDLNIGLAYLKLGQPLAARRALGRVRAVLISQNLSADLAECEMYLAEVYLRCVQPEDAQATLERARALFHQNQQDVYMAMCDRLLAQASAKRGERGEAQQRLSASRAVFVERGLPVDVALCDLTHAELCLAWGDYGEAKQRFAKAYALLAPAFPDQAWHASYGLGRVALAQGDPAAALAHDLNAVRTVASVRAALVTEQWSNDFFGSRQQVYDEALGLAVAQGQFSAALEVIEAAKAQTLLAYLARRDWQRPAVPAGAAETEALIGREAELRYQLADRRSRLAVQMAPHEAGALRSVAEIDRVSIEALKELEALGQAYETVVTRLRWARTGLAGVPSLVPFTLDEFRRQAAARWGDRWAALAYYLNGSTLTIAYLGPADLQVSQQQLSAYDRFVLNQCTAPHLDRRERVYRGTVRGKPAPASGMDPLRYLLTRLIPERLRAAPDGLTLLISPHGPLHQLPFHALRDGDTYLLERFPVVYTPTLQVWAQLNAGPAPSQIQRLLLCGLDEFGPRAQPLPYTAGEMQALQELFAGRSTSLWKQVARRRTLLDWNASGELRKFDRLHFATHAVVEPEAPHWSRILLADEDLTVADILDLTLEARLVTLSACSSALGATGAGDELVALARAFFYAGARALVASLWAVEDQSTAELMVHFYRRLREGETIASALHAAQLEMLHQGFTPFHWAPFVVMGDV